MHHVNLARQLSGPFTRVDRRHHVAHDAVQVRHGTAGIQRPPEQACSGRRSAVSRSHRVRDQAYSYLHSTLPRWGLRPN